MKPKDLKHPFPFKDRRPFYQDMVFFVPEYYFEHEKSLFPSLSEIFLNDRAPHLEYCSGNGDWILQKAKENPSLNFIALEKDFERVRKIYSKRHNQGIKNLLIVSGEALTFTKHYLPDNSIKEASVNFPDPWPKDKHAKHRLIQQPFEKELKRVILDGGNLTLATDHDEYVMQMRNVMDGWTQVDYTPKEGEYGQSYFEVLWRSKGKSIHFLRYLNAAAV